MLAPTRSRVPSLLARISHSSFRPLTSSSHHRREGPGSGSDNQQPNDPTPRKLTPNVSKTNELAVDAMGAQDKAMQEATSECEQMRVMQAPNRAGVWSKSQMPRERAMTGPRFEQTIMETQPRPYAAIELIHKQPVRWTHERKVACDGGGGPLGHPKIFINVDKPQVNFCTYCGLPYANEHHRKHLESLPSTPYPLKPTGDPAEVVLRSTPSLHGHIDGTSPHLVGEMESQSVDGKPFHQR